jgi:predicted transcriptional regulator
MTNDLFGETPKLTRSDVERIIQKDFNGYALKVAMSVVALASKLEEVTPEDIRSWCEPEPGISKNVFGDAMNRVVSRKWLIPVRMTRAKRKEAKGRRIPVYRRNFELNEK